MNTHMLMPDMSNPPERAKQAAELYEWGLALLRQRFRREQPAADDAAIEQLVRRWLMEREGTFALTKARDPLEPPAA